MKTINCPCGTGLQYENCCQPYHLKIKIVPTAETLMRTRYSAFVLSEADYLYETTWPGKRTKNSKNAYLKSAKDINWIKLEIVSAGFDVVEFKAFYLDKKNQISVLHEKSNFKQAGGKWFYVDGIFYS